MPSRIDRSKISNGEITMLAKTVHVNFWGTILTTNKITFNNGYCNVDEEKDINFLEKQNMNLKEFLEKNSLNKKQQSGR